MNFKLTITKTIISVVVGIIIGLAFGWQETISFGWMFNFGPFLFFLIISFIIVYVVWSLIEKKKIKKK